MRKLATLTAAAALATFGLLYPGHGEATHLADQVAYWPFDDDTADDQAAAGAVDDDGTLNGDASFSTDVPPVPGNLKSIDLDGSGDFVSVPDSADLDQAGDFTITAWVALDVDKNVNAILEKVNAANTTRNYEVLVWAASKPNKVTFAVTFDAAASFGGGSGACDPALGNNTCWVTGATAFVDGSNPLGTWRHIAVVYDDSAKTLTAFLDGANDGTATITTTGSPQLNNEDVRIGSRKSFAADDVNGRIDEVMVFDRALSGTEVSFLADGGISDQVADGCADASPNGVDINILTVTSDGTDITVTMQLCAAPVTGAKYRAHFDYTGDLASDGNALCVTTSDDTMMRRITGGGPHDTGPGSISLAGLALAYIVGYSELGLFGGDMVEIWGDTHDKGIVDRAPDTDGTDGCSKPQGIDEVLKITLDD